MMVWRSFGPGFDPDEAIDGAGFDDDEATMFNYSYKSINIRQYKPTGTNTDKESQCGFITHLCIIFVVVANFHVNCDHIEIVIGLTTKN